MSEENKEVVEPDKVVDPTPATDEPAAAEPAPTPQEPAEPAQEPTEEPTPEPAEEPAPAEEPEEEPQEEANLDYNEYEDPALRQMVKILKGKEIPVEVTNDVFGEAIETRDLSKVKLDVLKEHLGEEDAETVMVMATAYAKGKFSEFAEINKTAYDITGGQQNYDNMKAWAQAKEQSDPEFAKEMAEIRALVDTGSPKAIKAAVTELFEVYKADPNTTIEADLTQGDSANGKAGIKPISRREHGRLVDEAIKKGTYEQEKQKFWAMRQEGIKQNIN
jgi:hypothetical protein